MWEPRRKFWLSLHEQNRIDAAWVAFSRSGASHARRQLRSRGSRSLLSFGNQTARGSRMDTSLLILKIAIKSLLKDHIATRCTSLRPAIRIGPRSSIAKNTIAS